MSQHPERLGKYRITGVLGEGAMGVVYRGFDPDIRRVVALKTIRHMGGQDAEAVARSAARFRNEAQAAGRLLHPGIVGVYDFGDDGRVAYIAMEFVEGHTLAQYQSHFQTHKLRFPDADIASIAQQLLDGLGHAHEHGVWHRDVKPSNAIVTQGGRVKIADFGIARLENSGLTLANSVLGTPMYMAPEQFMGRPLDHRADLYSVGVVMYQLVAGRPPFMGSHESLMYKVVNEVPVPASHVEGGDRTSRFDAVIACALAKSPAERFASAMAFRDAVAQALGHPAPAAVSSETVFTLPKASDFAPTERIAAPPSNPGSSAPPTHWDPAVLAQVEAALVRHVGPMAKVMVRRTARECHDLPTLQARLAEQITQASARDAFLAQLAPSTGGSRSGALFGSGGSAGSGARSTGGTGGSRPPAPSTAGQPNAGPPPHTGGSGDAPVTDALIEQAHKILAGHVGPIAKVLVRRAADRTRQRGAFIALLCEAAPDADARARLQAELDKLR